MKNYTPKGIQSYGYLECNRDFEQGKVAQYWEADPSIGEFLDPTKSKVVNDVGFSVLPCPPTNPDHCVANAGGGWFLNSHSKNKDASWELLKWLTSLDNQVKWGTEAKTTFQVTRNQALPLVSTAVGFPKEVSDALTYAHGHAHPSPFPPIPNIMDMVLAASRMCTTVVAGQASVDDALAQAQKEITDSMIKNKLLKP
jgi:multiple sugar transport system substrate-binding protein